jgi:hypothetical protein
LEAFGVPVAFGLGSMGHGDDHEIRRGQQVVHLFGVMLLDEGHIILPAGIERVWLLIS